MDFTAACDVVEDEVGQDVLAGVGDPLHPSAAGAAVAVLDGDHDERLAGCATPPAPRFDAADQRLVDLDGTVEQLAAGTDHRAAQLVQPRPCGLVAAESEHALQAQRADAVLLVDDVPDRREPADQWRPRAGQDRACRDRGLAPARRAATQPVGLLPPIAVHGSAEAADESVAPAQALQEAQACRVVREPGQQLVPVARVVHAGHRVRLRLHRCDTLQTQGERSG